MNKTFVGLLSFLVAVSLFGAPYVEASHSTHQPPIPEKNGTYDDPNHPGVKVRVFVHPERSRGVQPEKPVETSSSAIMCELPDPDSGAFVDATPWHLPASWTYQLNPSSVPSSVGGSNLPIIAGNGFTDWAAAANDKVTFTRGSDTSVARQAYDGRNIIAWGRTSGSALGVTYVRYYTSSGLAVDVDTIMNKKFPWKWSNSNMCADSDTYDAENILTHELGHWLGLEDEYAATHIDNTMFGYGSKGEVKKNTLTTGDTTGTAAIYPL